VGKPAVRFVVRVVAIFGFAVVAGWKWAIGTGLA
jgi:hypothetical protein